MEALAQLESPPGLVFKGGTALRLCFYEDYRLLRDLLIQPRRLTVPEGLAVLGQALERCVEAIGLPHLSLAEAQPLQVEYVGPLGRERAIKLDLADDELVLDNASSGDLALSD